MKAFHLPTFKVEGKFPLGVVILGSDAADVLLTKDVNAALKRHAQGDWGAITREERKRNEQELARANGNLRSAHRDGNGIVFHVTTIRTMYVTFVSLADER